jgi:hypothetical protein
MGFNPTWRTTMYFIAIGPLAWGKGETEKLAVSRMRRAIPYVYVRSGYGYKVYRVSDATGIDGMGSLSYSADGPAPELVFEKKRRITKVS